MFEAENEKGRTRYIVGETYQGANVIRIPSGGKSCVDIPRGKRSELT